MFSKPKLNNENLESLEGKLLVWRDNIARFEDENIEFILPSTLLNAIINQSSQIQSVDHLIEISKALLNNYVPQFVE